MTLSTCSRYLSRVAALLGCVSVLSGCAAVIDLPAVTEAPTGTQSPGKIIWHDLLTHDVDASKRFYGELFGWEFESVSAGYTLIRHEGRMIGGMIDTIALNGRDDISQWVVVMSVADVDDAIGAVESGGGKVIGAPRDLQRRGRIAVVADAEGALFALLQTKDGDPPDYDPVVNGFLWDEAWTRDAESAMTFYSALTGLEVTGLERESGDAAAAGYRVLRDGERPRFGLLPHPLEGLGPVWVSYLRVDDPAAICERVADLGGRVIVAAQNRNVGGQAAMIAGPSGAGIALQTWPLRKDN